MRKPRRQPVEERPALQLPVPMPPPPRDEKPRERDPYEVYRGVVVIELA